MKPAPGAPLNDRKPARALIALGLLLLLLCPLSADAAKKKKGGGDTELQKSLEPISQTLEGLLDKVQSNTLFSAKEAGELINLKFTMMDLIKDNPTSPLLMKPAYQAALLYKHREQFSDAYELFTFLNNTFPDTPYGQQARSELFKMKKLLGEHYFAPNPTPPPTEPTKK
jgi:hypothetical protein